MLRIKKVSLKIKKIPQCYLITLIAIALLCIPYNSNGYPLLTRLLRYISYGIFAWSVLVFRTKKMYKLKWYVPFWILLILMVISTAANDISAVKSCVECVIRLFAIVVLFEFMMQYNSKLTIIWNATIWTVLMLIEAISEVTDCFGYASTVNSSDLNNYLFGIRNEINQYVIYAFFFCFLAMYIGKMKEKVKLFIVLFSGIYFAVVQEVSTAISGIVVFFVVLLGSKLVKKKVWWRIYLAVLAISIFLFIKLQNTAMFQVILVTWLHEDLTLNGRIILWPQALEQARGIHAIIGFGFSPKYTLRIGSYVVNHPHNQFIQFIFNYGYPGLVLYLWMMWKSVKKILAVKDYKIRMISIATISATVCMCISSRNYFYLTAQIFYVILRHINELTSSRRKGDNS